ncbi:ATP-grasp domain-containing protein [Arachidicoccus terrestris]|uniref:ATP-grasp domain-containing protein n=1 Tax=Arachidicoccus terrestris TaxID=2875539 RepID=UPI001CC778A1|nr:hypothetical protein [Arachidicoccus terrestris]UAY54310.1 hypothetical protein K9M52_12700 [Arachidicoccus terrestris]
MNDTKKIGILFGQENSFPQAFIQRINDIGQGAYQAEAVLIDKVFQGMPTTYHVIVDRISHDVPFYRAFVKNAALQGTAVINNPFWWSADEKFFNNCLAEKIDIALPRTAILPSFELPEDTTKESFRNLAYPLDWDSIFGYVGFPAYMKPFAGGGWKSVYRVENTDHFFEVHKDTSRLVMLLQEEILFEEYYRCYCVGGKYVKTMGYDPRNPAHLRYQADFDPSPELLRRMENDVLKINQYLGYDFNTVEFAVRDGIPYAIDFCNPAPDADKNSVGEENFEWVVAHMARFAIEKAEDFKEGIDNLTWGKYLRRVISKEPLIS